MSDGVNDGVQRVHLAAAALEPVEYAEGARSLRRQADAAWFLDPTAMVRPGAQDNLEVVLRLFDAAAAFQAAYREVVADALERRAGSSNG